MTKQNTTKRKKFAFGLKYQTKNTDLNQYFLFFAPVL